MHDGYKSWAAIKLIYSKYSFSFTLAAQAHLWVPVPCSSNIFLILTTKQNLCKSQKYRNQKLAQKRPRDNHDMIAW